jgi:fucose 4-O-acetylase-like acetyltransferase
MHAHKAARWSSSCLWLIGVVTFLPTVRSCDRIVSPAALMREGGPRFWALLSPFAVAELLALIAIAYLVTRREPTRRALAGATLLVLAAAASPAVVAYGWLQGPLRGFDRFLAGAALSALAGGLAVVIVPRGAHGWQRWRALVDAYTIFTLPLAMLLVQIGAGDGARALGPGGYLFVAAVAGLAGLAISSLRAITRA